MIVVTWGAATDPGKLRPRNEDALLAQAPLFVVADGMGGHQGGALASRTAVETFGALLDVPTLTATDVARQVQRANDAICRGAQLDPAASDMGTTAVGLALLSDAGADYWLAFNIGDSRLYRRHGGALTQVSVDHSYVQELVLAGFLDADDARRHPERSIITRALGARETADPDYWVLPAEPGDRWLLCSDGLTGELDDTALADVLGSDDEPEAVAELLVRRANEAGGRDNITVVVVDVT